MKRILLGLTMTVLASCGVKREVVQLVSGNDGGSCRTQQLLNGSKITCDDGSFSYIYNGLNGSDGASCSVEAGELGALISCSDGSNASLLNGSQGEAGQSCSLEEIENGALITCGDESVAIYNGERGENGQDGEDALASLVEILNFKADSCEQISDTGLYVRFKGTNASLYNNDKCKNPQVILINDGESYWISNSLLAIKSKNTFKVINFGSQE
jgi:hypothetical protein